MVDEDCVKHHRRPRGWCRVVTRLPGDNCPRSLAQVTGVEQIGERGALPAQHRGRLEGEPDRVEDRARRRGREQLAGDRAERADAALQPLLLVRERLHQPVEIVVPAGGHPEGEVGEDERVEAVAVHRQELDLALEADAAEDPGDRAARLAVAEVVEPDVELPLALAAEDVRGATGDVVLLEHDRSQPVGLQISGGRQPTES